MISFALTTLSESIRYFAIPAEDTTAVNGVYKDGPGKKLTDAINSVVDHNCIIAEDLGVVVDAVGKVAGAK